MSQTPSPQDGRFEIGRVVADGLRRLIRYWPALVCLEALGLASSYGLNWFYRSFYPSTAALRSARSQPVGSEAWAMVLAAGVVGLILAALIRFAATRVALAEPPSLVRGIADALRTTFRAGPALVIVAVVTEFPSLIDLAVPVSRNVLANLPRTFAFPVVGLALHMLLGPAIPVLAGDGLGPLETIQRSMRLVNRQRWSFFAITMMTLPLDVLAVLLVAFSISFTHRPGLPPAVTMIQTMLGLFSALITIVLAAAAYRELTRVKEGWRPTDTADVFD